MKRTKILWRNFYIIIKLLFQLFLFSSQDMFRAFP